MPAGTTPQPVRPQNGATLVMGAAGVFCMKVKANCQNKLHPLASGAVKSNVFTTL